MGSSWISLVPSVVKTALACDPHTVLDLGMGAGKYGFLLREQTDFHHGRNARDEWNLVLTGVEGHGPTIGDHQRAVYDTIVESDILSFLKRPSDQQHDLGLIIDVIEHFTPLAAVELMGLALDRCRFVLVSTPRYYFSQDEFTNVLERHLSWWPAQALKRLAAMCDAKVSYAHVYMSSVALYSRETQPPRVVAEPLSTWVRCLRDTVVPASIYYGLRGVTGPSLTDAEFRNAQRRK